MKKKISIKGYIKKEFDSEGAPSPVTVRRWCQRGKIPARKIDGSWFIIVDRKIEPTGNSLVDKVLAG